MPAPTPAFQMVADVLALPDKASCALHVTVSRAESIDTFEYQNETRTKQFLLVEDAAGAKVGVRWFGPKFDLRAGDVVQMYPGAKEDRATCRVDTDNSGKRIVKVSPLGMSICGEERPAAVPVVEFVTIPATQGQQQPAGGGAPPNYSQPAQSGQQRPAAANGGPAPVMRQRYDHKQILAMQRAVFLDRWDMVCGLLAAHSEDVVDATTSEMLDIATRLTATVVIAAVDGKIDLAQASPAGSGQASNGPPADYQEPGPQAGAGPGEGEDDSILFFSPSFEPESDEPLAP